MRPRKILWLSGVEFYRTNATKFSPHWPWVNLKSRRSVKTMYLVLKSCRHVSHSDPHCRCCCCSSYSSAQPPRLRRPEVKGSGMWPLRSVTGAGGVLTPRSGWPGARRYIVTASWHILSGQLLRGIYTIWYMIENGHTASMKVHNKSNCEEEESICGNLQS